jgi:branched-chain amino acid aminotransferase
VALTPRSAAGLLEGLTRAYLFDVGRDVGVPVEEATLRPEDLDTADEAFVTGSTRELTPVVRVDDRIIGTGRPGPITRALLDGFRKRAWELSAQHAAR